MGYSTDSSMVRVDFFRPNGKWYCTEAVKWTGEWIGANDKKQDIFEAFKQSLKDHFKDNPNRLSDMDAVCLEPYHEWTHPIILKNGSWWKIRTKQIYENEITSYEACEDTKCIYFDKSMELNCSYSVDNTMCIKIK